VGDEDQATMANLAIGELAALEGRFAWAMLEMDIDYWDRGDRTLAAVADERGVLVTDLCLQVQECGSCDGIDDYPVLRGLSAVELIDHMTKSQFLVLNKEMANLTRRIPQVLQRYGGEDRRLALIEVAFSQVRSELVSHIAQQRYVFFPAIRERALSSNEIRSKKSWTEKMAFRGDELVAGLVPLRSYSDGFREPPNGDLAWIAMVESLKRLTYCAYHHIYTLNWVLLPLLSQSEENC